MSLKLSSNDLKLVQMESSGNSHRYVVTFLFKPFCVTLMMHDDINLRNQGTDGQPHGGSDLNDSIDLQCVGAVAEDLGAALVNLVDVGQTLQLHVATESECSESAVDEAPPSRDPFLLGGDPVFHVAVSLVESDVVSGSVDSGDQRS